MSISPDISVQARGQGQSAAEATPTRAAGAHTGFAMLLALNDDPCGESILALAQTLASERGALPTVLHVVEIGAGVGVGVSMLLDTFEHDPEFVGLHADTLRRRFRGSGVLERWPIEIRVGDATAGILKLARQIRPALILMGLGRHGRLGRAVGDDTTREVMREGIAPVLALPPLAAPYRPSTQLPARVLVAMDFSAASMRAAHLARAVMQENGIMHLAHVRFPLLAHESERYEGMQLVHTAGVHAAFDAAIRELSGGGALTIAPVTLDGDPAPALLALAERLQPDLIAIGNQRHAWLERLLLGSVARAIADDGRWPVLVTPPLRRPPPRADSTPIAPAF